MMDNRMKQLMDATGGIREAYIEEAAMPRHKQSVWPRLVSVAAAAVLIVGMLFATEHSSGNPGQDSTGGSDGDRQPLFGIRVYAAEGLVDLNEAAEGTIFAGEEVTDPSNEFGLLTDGTVYAFNTITGEWEIIQKEDGERLPQVVFEILWEEFDDYRPCIEVKCNDEVIDIAAMKNNFLVGFIGYKGRGMVGWALTCSFEEQSILEVTVRDMDTEMVLMQQVILVTPALYEMNDSMNGETTVLVNEGYMLEVLDYYIISVE